MSNSNKKDISAIEIIINSDGSIMVPRGDNEHNNAVRDLFLPIVNDSESLNNFLKITDDSKHLLGKDILCG